MIHAPKRFMDYLKLHKDCNRRILDHARTIPYDELDVSTDPDIIRIKKMVNNVMAEIHLMRGFVRLQPIGEKVLYGFLKPEHDIGERVGYHLSRRFPETIIILGNNSNSWISIFDGKRVHNSKGGSLSSMVEEFRELTNGEESPEVEGLWKTYYWSQYCEERRNIKYYRSNMPKKYQDAAGMKVARNTGRTSLDDFIK